MGYIKEPHGVTFTVLGLGITPEEQIALSKVIKQHKEQQKLQPKSKIAEDSQIKSSKVVKRTKIAKKSKATIV